MIDIHCHILPEVDDGAGSFYEAIEMARIYIDNGIEKVIATPHFIDGYDNKDLDLLIETRDKLRGHLAERKMDLQIYLGQEIFITMDIFKYLDNKKITTLNGSRYILLELPLANIPAFTKDVIYELRLKDYVPIIAHPERNAKIQDNPNILYDYIKSGALAQLNLPSLEGKYGNMARKASEILILNKMVHFIGTDAHSMERRNPEVRDGLEVLKNLVDLDYYEKITKENAQRVIDNLDIEIEEPILYERESFFKKFLTRYNR